MTKCEFYSEYICKYYEDGLCHYSEKVFGSSLPESCSHIDDFENCACFEPIEDTVKLMLDNGRPTDKTALTIQNCDKIILKPKSLEVEFNIEKDNFGDFDYIIINEHKFRREK